MNNIFLLFLYIFSSFLYAKSNVDCRKHVDSSHICNPYVPQLINVKNVTYEKNRKKAIVDKILPAPYKVAKPTVTDEDILGKKRTVEDPLRFNSTESKKESRKVIKVVRYYGKYKVAKNDTLKSVASKFHTTIKELYRINILEKNDRLHQGDTLRISLSQDMIDAIVSGSYSIKSGDTILSVAKKFKLNTKDIILLNNIKTDSMIKVGQKIKLPFVVTQKKKSTLHQKHPQVKKYTKKKTLKKMNSFGKHKLRVTATAYSSHAKQTDKTPFLAAWNNRLRPGMKIIAVSRDMLTLYGMKNGTRVRIAGLSGYYTVRDKMNKRFRRRIDIYMGTNRRRALHWGRRSVVVYW